MTHNLHSTLMLRCIELAKKGLGAVSPNPLVGSVIADEGHILAEGYHEKFGEAHAEVNALKNLQSPEPLSQATLYVSLEPCCHHGKTPPCVEVIQQAGIRRVVFGMIDPNPQVNGSGRKYLEEAGIEVISGIEQEKCEALNTRYLTNIREKRPYIILKWAQTADGFIAKSDYSSKWISSEESRTLVHRWRSEEDAVLVGTTTTLKDNPQLNVRMCEGRDPKRIVLDRTLKIPESSHIYDGAQETLLVSEQKPRESCQWIPWPKHASFWRTLLPQLYEKGIGSILIEGGSHTITSLLDAGYWDEARVFEAPISYTAGIPAPVLPEKGSTHTIAIKKDILHTVHHRT